jgi:hypothetical protein
MAPHDTKVERIKLTGKRKLPITGKMAKDPHEPEPAITNMMMDPRYLRQSSSLIQEALQKGFDVLQLANGDIVTTGTKTIVYQYTWDEERSKLMRIKPDAGKKAKRMADAMEDADDEESEEA